MVLGGSFHPASQKGLRCTPRPFCHIPHLENNILVLGNISKTLIIDSSQVTEDPFDPPTSGAAQVTWYAPSWGQAPLLFSVLNTSAIVSPFLSSFQSISKVSVSPVAPSISI